MPSPACAAIRDPLSMDTYGSRAPAPKTHPLQLVTSALMQTDFGWQLQQQTTKLQRSYLSATRSVARGNIGSRDFLICSLVMNLGKRWEISQISWTETDVLVNTDFPSTNPCGASISYTFTAVLMKLQLSLYNLKKRSSFESSSKNYKINRELTDLPKHAPGQAAFLELQIKYYSRPVSQLLSKCDSPEVCVAVKRD